METIINADQQLFLWLHAFRAPWADGVMWFISHKLSWIPLYVAVLVFMFRVKNPKQALVFLVALVLVIVAADQFSTVVKNHTLRFRPSWEPALEGMVQLVNNYRGGRYGYFSAHAANSFGFAVFSSLYFVRPWYTKAIMLWAFVVAYSRIYLGVHYPGDIVTGALVGSGLGCLFYFLAQKMVTKFGNRLA